MSNRISGEYRDIRDRIWICVQCTGSLGEYVYCGTKDGSLMTAADLRTFAIWAWQPVVEHPTHDPSASHSPRWRERMTDRLFDPEAFALEVRLAMAAANVSYRQLEAMCAVDQASIHRVAKKGLPPSVETYLRLRRWIDAKPIPEVTA